MKGLIVDSSEGRRKRKIRRNRKKRRGGGKVRWRRGGRGSL